MKLISLNCWGGKLYRPLTSFLKDYSEQVDIFCLQEVFSSPQRKLSRFGMRTNLLQELEKIFPDFNSFFAPVSKHNDFGIPVDHDLEFGQATFVRKNIKVNSSGDIFVYLKLGSQPKKLSEEFIELPKTLQYLEIEESRKKFLITNFHGLAFPFSKEDTPGRIKQSQRIMKFLHSKSDKKILTGDFNLNPDTKSITLLENSMVNLIKKFKVKKTRSRLYKGEHSFADYTFVTPDIKVLDFKTINVTISDHLPLSLEFN
ncbi:hypothetical protein HYS93_01525 [Candidatus Daviesbacteria bacterium]|nr:hypothetical protein [Candidatus Daviesbacteria bacterium]